MGVVGRRLLATTLFALLVAAGFWQLQRDTDARSRHSAQQLADAKLFDCPELGHVTEVRLDGPRGAYVLARRAQPQQPAASTPPAGDSATAQQDAEALQAGAAQGTWQLQTTGPSGALQTAADDSTVQALLQAACDLTQLGPPVQKPAETADTPHPYAPFGLMPPQHVLTLRTVAGPPQVLQTGFKNSFDGSLFVRRGEEDVLRRVDGTFSFQLERDAFSLREKRLLLWRADAVQTLQLHPHATARRSSDKQGVQPFGLQRQGSGFVLAAAGQQAAADTTQATSLINALCEMRAKQFMDEAPDAAALARFGLQSPHLVVELSQDGNAKVPPVQVRFGRIYLHDTAHDFVQVGGVHAPIAELPSPWLVEKLSQGSLELRDMHVLNLQAADVAQLRICSPGAGAAHCVQFRREGDSDVPLGRRAFVFDSNGSTDKLPQGPADSQRLATLVGRLAELRADSFAAAPRADLSAHQAAHDQAWQAAAGLGEAAMTVSFADAQGAPLATLQAGLVDGRHRLVLGNRRPDVARIFAAALEGVSWHAADYVDPTPAMPPP